MLATMKNFNTTSKPLWLVFIAVFAVTATNCSNENALGPNDANQLRFSEPIALGDLNGQLAETPVRAEIKLLDDGLVAREVEIESPDEMFRDEKLEFAILSVDDAAGTLVVDFADLSIQFDGSTTFEGFDGKNITRAEFIAFVLRELGDGRRVGVEAKRPAPVEPQAPDDATFLAAKLELEDVDDRKVEMNIDSDNLTINDPDAVIQVLGRQVELRLGDGTTKLEQEDDDFDDEIKFKDFVASTGDNIFTLRNGTIVRIVDGVTQIDERDDKHRLGSLAEVQQAIDAGLSVRAKGEGIIDPDNAGTLIAIEVRFKIKREDKQISLQELALLLGGGSVRAEIELLDGGLVVRELEIESEDDDEKDEEEIEANIVAIDAGGSITVDIDGLTINFDENTKFEGFDGKDITLTGFVALVEGEIAAGKTPRVEAKRPRPVAPQAPDDGTFLATEIELDDDNDKSDDEREIEINVSAANLIVNDPRPTDGPDATIQVLGVTFEIRITEGLTKIEVEG